MNSVSVSGLQRSLKIMGFRIHRARIFTRTNVSYKNNKQACLGAQVVPPQNGPPSSIPVSHAPYQDDFYLLDVIGGQNISCLHPTKPIVAYTAGCMIIVYDMISDAKIQLVNHQHEVRALTFTPVGAGGSPTGGDHLISIDSNRNDAANTATMCLWNWSKGTCVQQITLPQQQTQHQLQENSHFIVKFDKTGTLFTIVQSTLTNYRISVWAFSRHSAIDLIAHQDLDHQSGCLAVAMLRTKQQGPTGQPSQVYLNQGLQFMTLEKNCIKLWQFQNGGFELLKRIHIKVNISQLLVAELTGFLLILGDNGKVLILDQLGEFVSTVYKQGVHFTSLGIANDKLLLGTDRGQIHVYHLASLSFVSEIPYQFSLLPQHIMNGLDHHVTDEEPWNQSSALKIGPPVRSIELTNNLRFIKIQYADSSFLVTDRSAQSKKEAIIGWHYGHFEQINDIQWIGQHPSRDHSNSYEQQQYSLIYQSNECFITVGADLSVFVWRHYGDRWQFTYIDVAKSFDDSLSFQRKACDRSTQDLQLTACCIYPRRRQNILIADNRGTVRLYQLGKEQATQLSTFTLAHGDREKIDRLFITENEQICVVTFASGQIACYDIKASFQWLGNVESASALSAMHLQKSVVFEKQPSHQHSDVYATLAAQQTGTQVKVFSVTAPNCIRCQLVECRDSRMTKSQLVQYFIAEGRISGFDIHPSKDYLLVTSNKGKVYVFRVETGELRGTICVPQHAQGCLVDPSGLYVVVQVPPISQNQCLGQLDLLGSNEKNLQRTTILMYEIGTGRPASEIMSIFDIANMKFSNDARYLALGSRDGSVSVWALGDHLYSNVQQVLEAASNNKDFWYNYPIFLNDCNSNVPLPKSASHHDTVTYHSLDQNKVQCRNTHPNPYLNYLPSGQTQNRVDRMSQVVVERVDPTMDHQLNCQRQLNLQTLNQRVEQPIFKPEVIVDVDHPHTLKQHSHHDCVVTPTRQVTVEAIPPPMPLAQSYLNTNAHCNNNAPRSNSPHHYQIINHDGHMPHKDQTNNTHHMNPLTMSQPLRQSPGRTNSPHRHHSPRRCDSPNRAQNLYRMSENDVKKISFWGDQPHNHKENKQEHCNVERPWNQPHHYQQYFNKRADDAVIKVGEKEPVVERIYPDRYNGMMHTRSGSPHQRYNQGSPINQVGQRISVEPAIKVEPVVDHLHTQYPMPQAVAPYEAFQQAQPYIELVPGSQDPTLTKVKDINSLKAQPVSIVEPPPFRIQELNYMDRSLNDRESVKVQPNSLDKKEANAANLYGQEFVKVLDKKVENVKVVPIEKPKSPARARKGLEQDPDDIDADIDAVNIQKKDLFQDVRDPKGMTLSSMHDQENRRLKELMSGPMSPTINRNVQMTPKLGAIEQLQQSPDIAESIGSNIDDAYKAIDDFERRREMQQTRKEIINGERMVQGRIFGVQRFPAGMPQF